MTTFVGSDDLREWLISQGFRCSLDSLQSESNKCNWYGESNKCNWYAYRKSTLPARECESNDGKAMQLVIKPRSYVDRRLAKQVAESVEVDVTGEANGVWFKLQTYALRHDELRSKLPEIEQSLIGAWNALCAADDCATGPGWDD